MSTNGNGIHNGTYSEATRNGHVNPWLKITGESANLGVAEVVSGVVSLGTWGLLPEIAPGAVNAVSKAVSKAVVESHLETLQKILGTVCHLKECQPDPSMTKEQQAEQLARAAVLFSASFATSFASKLLTRKLLNNAMGISRPPKEKTGNWAKDHLLPDKHDWGVVVWDETVHIGALLAANTAFAKQSDYAIDSVSGWMQKQFGWSEKKSKEMAGMFVIWEVPNMIGWLAGVGKIAQDQLKSASHVEKVASQAANLTIQPSHS